jgi:hypothetical protein
MGNLEKITAALTRLLTSEEGFVIVEDPGSGKFVQFAGSDSEPLLLDLPTIGLTVPQIQAAERVFGSKAAQGSFNRECKDPAEGAALALKALHDIFGFSADAPFTLTSDETGT